MGNGKTPPPLKQHVVPGKHGVFVHTNNLDGYEKLANGAVAVPPASDSGRSGAFSVNREPEVIVDPSDPSTGAGGRKVNLRQVDARALAALRSGADFEPAESPVVEEQQVPVAAAAIPVSSPASAAEPAWLGRLEQLIGKMVASQTPAGAIPTPSFTAPEPAAVNDPPDGPEDYAAIGLDFLRAVPAPPREQVIFDLGLGGIHQVCFHAVLRDEFSLSFIYDERYEGGHRFMPPVTRTPIVVSIPRARERFRCIVTSLRQTLGCMDILNLLIIPDEAPEEATDGQSEDADVSSLLGI